MEELIMYFWLPSQAQMILEGLSQGPWTVPGLRWPCRMQSPDPIEGVMDPCEDTALALVLLCTHNKRSCAFCLITI